MALRILLDINRLTDLFRGDRQIAETVESAVEVWLPFVAVGELKAGFLCGARSAANEALLAALLALPGVDILYADRETTEVYARLFYHLRSAGTPIPTNDLWIASLTIQHHLVLLTRDEHFARIPQIARL